MRKGWSILIALATTAVTTSSAIAEATSISARNEAAIYCTQSDDARVAFQDKHHDAGASILAYSEGPRNGPTIVFVPGMAVPRRSYALVAKLLCDRFHVVLLDQRGQGESTWAADGRYRVVDYGRDLAGFIRNALGGGPVIVSGHSLGGLVALWLAAEEPDLVSGLNAEDNPFLMSERDMWMSHWIRPMFVALERRLTAYQASGRDESVLRRLYGEARIVVPNVQMPYHRRLRAMGKWLSNLEAAGIHAADAVEQARIDAACRKFLAGEPLTNAEFWPRAALERLAIREAAMDPRVVSASVTAELNDGFSHRAAFAKIDVPTLFWSSDQDLLGVLTPAQIQELVQMLRVRTTVRLEVLQNTGHLIHAEQPDAYAREIASFFLRPAAR